MGIRALAAMAVLGAVTVGPSGPARPYDSLCSPLVDARRANVCLPASQVREAERLVPIAIDRTNLVWRETHLRLTQVVLSGGTRHPFGITYVYGHFPLYRHRLIDYSKTHPKFVSVGEGETNSGTRYAPPRLGLLLPPASWEFGAVVLSRGWSLDLMSNVRKDAVRKIGWSLVRAARGGK